jgi:Mg-chelatase subunit ChlD
MWIPASVGREQFKTTNIELLQADTKPRLQTRIENSEVTDAQQIEVVATLFNSLGEPVTASQTFVDSLPARSIRDIVFTWPQPLTKTIRSCIIPTDVALVIDLSGSMNNDSMNPPQPITDTIAAAKIFAEGLKEKDQATLITFATNATLVVPLSRTHTTTAQIVSSLTIDPAEEAGYTNTAAGLNAAAAELTSERHNEDSRKVAVLLTDGMPTAKDDALDVVAEARLAAQALSASGVEVYAIGLGKGVNLDFVKQIASKEELAYYAPTTADLSSIYSNITSSLCESGTSRIDVIAKTRTNFAPLR